MDAWPGRGVGGMSVSARGLLPYTAPGAPPPQWTAMSATVRDQVSHLGALESESIHIFREVVAECERPVLLFSGGKDSIVLLRLAQKAFWPEPIPFPVLHIDTGHNFDEVLEFRDRRVAEL